MKTSALTAAIVFALFFSGHAFAQADDAETTCTDRLAIARASCAASTDAECVARALPDVCRETLVPATELERISVVGTRFSIDVQRYPGSVSVLLPDDIDNSPDIIQALKKVPGFDGGNDNGRAIGQQFSIRGFGHGSENRVIVMQDGVRRSANLFANQSSSFGIDSDLLKQAEVVRGASAITYGGGAIGGVVSTSTKDAVDFILPGRDFGVEFNYRFDSNNRYQGYGAFAIAPEDSPFEFLVFVKQSESDTLTNAGKLPNGAENKVDNHDEIGTVFAKVGWKLAPGHKLTLSHYDYNIDYMAAWNTLFHAAYTTANGAVIGDRSQRDTVLRYVANPAGSNWLNLSATLYRTQAYNERGYERGTDLYYKNLDERWGVTTQNLMTFDTGDVTHRLVAGFDFENREEDGIYLLGGVQTMFNSMPNRYRDLGVFVQHESRWFDETLAVHLGGRYDKFDREVHGVAESYDKSRFSPRIGLAWEIVDNFLLLANYSEAFRAPTPHETSSEGPLNPYYWYQPNPALKSETAGEYEVGFSWRKHGLFTESDRFNVKGMYFDGKIEDMIRAVIDYGSQAPGGREYLRYENVDGADRHGLELQASYDQERWGAFLNYETLDITDAVTKRKVPNAFADRARFGLSWRPFNDDFTLSADYTHWFKPDQNPETLVSGGVTYWYVRSSFHQANVQMRWRPTESYVPFLDGSTQFVVGINNLFDDVRLSPMVTEGVTRTGLGRNLYFSITKQF